MRSLFERQLDKARTADGEIDLDVLGRLVSSAYLEAEQDRTRTDRSIELMIGELDTLQAGLEAEIEKRTGQLRSSQRKLRTRNEHFVAALENMSHGLAMFDRNHRLLICNRQFLELYNLPQRLGRSGTSLKTILDASIAGNTWAGSDPDSYVRDRLAVIESGESTTATQRLNDGRVVQVAHRPMADGGWVTTHKDITDLHSMQAELTHQAYHDALTDLPNRHMLYQRMNRVFDSGSVDSFAVLCIDLDGFKTINDTMGHSSGDKLLRQVAIRLRSCIRDGDIIARMGGDEFAVLQAGSGPGEAAALAADIVETLRRPFEIEDKSVSISASIGIAVAPNDGCSADQLLRGGDMALYRAKRDGRGGHRRYEPAMDLAEQERRALERDLRQALANGEFELNFQPILGLRTQRFTGFEALLRWRHPLRGLVPPSEFIPMAEELGLIVPIGEWAIRGALAEAATWPPDLRIAVNVSSVQFSHGSIVGMLMSALAASQITPERVEIEITESVFLKNSESNLEALRQLHDLGLRIALDDFGTGYSALSYLMRFPFDKIKIDGSFVRGLSDAEAAQTIVRAVAEIGNRMGLETTAEGIETPEQLKNIHALGYSEAQGYLIARPMPASAVRRLLDEAYAGETPASLAQAV